MVFFCCAWSWGCTFAGYFLHVPQGADMYARLCIQISYGDDLKCDLSVLIFLGPQRSSGVDIMYAYTVRRRLEISTKYNSMVFLFFLRPVLVQSRCSHQQSNSSCGSSGLTLAVVEGSPVEWRGRVPSSSYCLDETKTYGSNRPCYSDCSRATQSPKTRTICLVLLLPGVWGGAFRFVFWEVVHGCRGCALDMFYRYRKVPVCARVRSLACR